MPPKLTDRSQRTRSAAASRLEIAQGKGHFPIRKQPPETIANTSQASATAPPPHSSARAQHQSRHTTSAAASTKRTTCSTLSTSYFPAKVINAQHLFLDSSEEEEESPAEGEGAATNSAEAEGKDHPQFSDSVNTGCTEGEAAATATHSEATTHSTEADGNAPMPSLLALNTTPNVGLFPPSSTGDLNPAASNEESFSDYDNDEDGDLNTGGDVKRRGDLLEELTATIMTGGKKKVPGGAFSPRRESLGILQEFMRKQKQVLPLFARQAEQDASSVLHLLGHVRRDAQRMISESKVHWKGRKRGRGQQKQQVNHRLRGASKEGKVGVVDEKEVQIKV